MFGVYHAGSLRSLNLAESVPPTPTPQEDHMSASVSPSTTVTPAATTTSAIVTHIPSPGQSTTTHQDSVTDSSNTIHHTSSSTASGSSSTAEVQLQDSTCKCYTHACI